MSADPLWVRRYSLLIGIFLIIDGGVVVVDNIINDLNPGTPIGIAFYHLLFIVGIVIVLNRPIGLFAFCVILWIIFPPFYALYNPSQSKAQIWRDMFFGVLFIVNVCATWVTLKNRALRLKKWLAQCSMRKSIVHAKNQSDPNSKTPKPQNETNAP